jgi:hypothetical protein
MMRPALAPRLLMGWPMTKLVAVALLATTAIVQAQPAATAIATEPAPAPAAPAATPPPQTHAWTDVNHINGQLVKVGEENDYLKKFKRWNVSANPIGWVLGFYGVSVSYGINNQMAIRGDVNFMKPVDEEDTTGVELGVGLPIYFRRTYQGLFLEPGLITRTTSSPEYCYECASADDQMVTSTTFGPQVLVGWHWTWSSGLNFAIAGGVGRNWATKRSEYADDELFGNGYLRFGYAF